jgi:peptidyl-prolyl cis-trans isomerase B (cyclophilin B)
MKTIAALIVTLFASSVFAQATQPVQRKTYSSPPEMKIDPNKKYTATLDTDKGKVVVELYAKEAPKTVNNFVFLAKEGFYNDTIFHRVIPEFMIQAGDPEGSGRGGPGYTFEDETNPASNPHEFKVGTLAMANRGPSTNGSQFFITEAATQHLQGKHTIFGQVKEGQDIVHAIATADADRNDRPREPIHLKSVTIKEE